MLLRKVFGPKRKGTTGGRIQLHNEELNDFYCLSYNARMITPMRWKWASPVAPMQGKGVRNIPVF